jgi:hypothetical protein
LRHLVLYTASGRFYFLPSAGAHFDAAHDDTLCDVAIREKLGRPFSFTDQSCLGQSLFGHFGAFRQLAKVIETDDLIHYSKDIRETTLRDAASKRHLAAFELGLAATRTVMARSRLDTLVSLSGSLTRARARSTAKSLAIPV